MQSLYNKVPGNLRTAGNRTGPHCRVLKCLLLCDQNWLPGCGYENRMRPEQSPGLTVDRFLFNCRTNYSKKCLIVSPETEDLLAPVPNLWFFCFAFLTTIPSQPPTCPEGQTFTHLLKREDSLPWLGTRRKDLFPHSGTNVISFFIKKIFLKQKWKLSLFLFLVTFNKGK